MFRFFDKIANLFQTKISCGMCGRMHSKDHEIEYLAKNDEGAQQVYNMSICSECFNTLDYLKDKKWMKG
jgi:hypothetical protein